MFKTLPLASILFNYWNLLLNTPSADILLQNNFKQMLHKKVISIKNNIYTKYDVSPNLLFEFQIGRWI